MNTWGLLPFLGSFIGVFLSYSLLADVPEFKRHTAFTMTIENYAPLANKKTSLDVGTQLTGNQTDNYQCNLLAPQTGTKASGQPWAPFDMYTNVETVEEQKKEEVLLGEPDIFFKGDDNNRNGGTASYQWTKQVQENFKGSLEFLEKNVKSNWFSFRIQFTRGSLLTNGSPYNGLLSVQSWPTIDGCKVRTLLCTKIVIGEDGKFGCDTKNWNKEIKQVIATADPYGAIQDKIKGIKDEKKKNDISLLELVVMDLDEKGAPKTAPYRMLIAKK